MSEIEKPIEFSDGNQQVPPALAAPFQVTELPLSPPPLNEQGLRPEASRLTERKPTTTPDLASPMVSRASSGGWRSSEVASLTAFLASSSGCKHTPESTTPIASPASSGGQRLTPQLAFPIASPASSNGRGRKHMKRASPRLSPSPKSKARRSLPFRDLSNERVIVRADSGSEGGDSDSDNGVGDEDVPVSELGVDFISLRATARRLRDHHVSLEGAVSNMLRLGEGGVGNALSMEGDFSAGVPVESMDEGKDIGMSVSRVKIEELGDSGYGIQAVGHGIRGEASGLGDAAPVGWVRDDGNVELSYEFSWSDDFTTFSGHEETYLRVPGPTISCQDPVDVLLNVWDRPIMERIADEINRYAWQTIAALSETEGGIPKFFDKWEDTTVEELYRLFAVFIYMSMCLRSNVQEYWTTGILGMPSFRTLMPRARFLLLTRFLHFVDNDTISPFVRSYHHKLAKIAPILEHCNNKFASLYTPAKYLSLDESLLLWKGRTKAARCGIKSFELCEAETGYLLRFLVYAGKDSSMHEGPILGFKNYTSKVVLELMDGFLDAGHVLVMDNWYNQLALTRYLKSRRTDVIGTLNRRSAHVPEAIKDLNERQLPRGGQIAIHCGDITLIAWNDVKLVTTISTFHKDNHVVSSEKPLLVHDYNKYMGGVDTKDQKLSMFVFERKRGKKWYLKVFKRLLNTSLLNAYIIYSHNPMHKILNHRQFRYKVAQGLLQRFPRNNIPMQTTSTCQVSDTIRLDNGKHMPAYTEVKSGKLKQRRRCVRCSALGKAIRVMTLCRRCDVALCLGPCWADYHTLRKLNL